MSEPGRRRSFGRLGLRARVILVFALGSLFTSAILAGTAFGISRNQLLNQRETSATQPFFSNARNVNQSLLTAESGTPIEVPALLQSLQTPARPALLFRGEWFTIESGFGQDAIPVVLQDEVTAGNASRMRFDIEGEPQLGLGVALPGVDAAYFEIVSLDELGSTLNSLGVILVGASILSAGVGASFGWWASRRALLPLAEVSDAAGAIAGGRLETRLQTAGDRDLDGLSASFNEMASALEDRIARDERFASDVSHELRSPLMTLSASIEVLETRREDLDERGQSALDLLAADISRFEQLVNDLLEISRFDAGAIHLSLEPVDPAALTRHAMDASASSTPVHVADDMDGVRIQADKRRMERVIANLLQNADNYAGGATGVFIERAPGAVRIRVEDAGPGIDPDQRAEVFDRFSRGGEAGRRITDGGVGLGLALVAEHIHLHGGRVWVDDRPDGGEGAAFVIELPEYEP